MADVDPTVSELQERGADAPSTWPPPPVGMQDVQFGRPIYYSGARLGRSIMILLAIGIAFDVVDVFFYGAHSTAALIGAGIANLIDFVVYLATAFCFLFWTYRVYANLYAYGTQGLRWSPGWAVGWFFIPFMSLYRPYQVFTEIWQASEPDSAMRTGSSWKNNKPPGLLLGWWSCYIGAGIIGCINIPLSMNTGHTDIIGDIVVVVFDAGAAVLLMRVIRRLSDRQEEAAKSLLQSSLVGAV